MTVPATSTLPDFTKLPVVALMVNLAGLEASGPTTKSSYILTSFLRVVVPPISNLPLSVPVPCSSSRRRD